MVWGRFERSRILKHLIESVGVVVIGVYMRFTIKGKIFDISREKIASAVRGRQPRQIRKYYVEIERTRWPIKQTIELVTGLHPIDFTSMYANDILSKLGFKVEAV